MNLLKNLVGVGTARICEDQKLLSEILERAIRLGIVIIDTAESYCNGNAEKIVGKVVNKFNRERLFIISKISPNHLSYDSLIEHGKTISKRLETYIDALLLHEPNESIELLESLKALKKLKSLGLIKMFGLSNFPIEKVAYAYKFGASLIEDEFNLIYRNEELLNFCKKNGIGFLAYRPFAGGELFDRSYVEILNIIGEKYGKTPAQVALKWVLKTGAIPIIGVSSVEHLKEDLNLDWTMSREDFELLSREFKNVKY